MAKHISGGHACMPQVKLTKEQRIEICVNKGHRWVKCGDGMFCSRCDQTAVLEDANDRT